MSNTQAGNTLTSSMPSQGGGQESRQKNPQVTVQQMIGNPFYFQEEFSVGQDSGPRNDGQKQTVPDVFYRDTADINLDPDVAIQQENTQRQEAITDNSGQEHTVEVKGFSANGTMYLRAETEDGKDMNEVAEEKPWFSIDKAGNIVQSVGDKAPGILKDAGGSFIDAGADLFKQTTGIGQEKPKPQPKTPEDQKKEEEKIKNRIANIKTQEMFDILNMPKHEVKVVMVGDKPVSVEEVNKLRKVSTDFKGDINANGTLTASAEAEVESAISDNQKRAEETAKTPFEMVNSRIGKKGSGIFNNNRQAENQIMNQQLG